jgi:hypothetical protein
LLRGAVLIFVGEIRERGRLRRIAAGTVLECFVHAMGAAIVETVIAGEGIGGPSFAICKGKKSEYQKKY